VVIVLPTGLEIRGYNPAENDRFLRAIAIRSTTSFGGQIIPRRINPLKPRANHIHIGFYNQ
jgi:hypothetical protein